VVGGPLRASGRRWRLLAVALGLGQATQLESRGAPEQSTLVLAPVIVEETVQNAPQWRYGKFREFEILSQCNDEATKSYILQLSGQASDFRQIVPARFLLETSLPTTFLLYPKWREKTMSVNMVRAMEDAGMQFPGSRMVPLPNLRLDEPDSTFMCAIVSDGHPPASWREMFHGSGGEYVSDMSPGDQVVLSEGYIRDLIAARAPAIPRWFAVGVSALYALDRFEADRFAFDPEPWLSPDEVQALRAKGYEVRAMLPLTELFVPAEPADRRAGYNRIWEAQAELFVRWTFAGGPERRQALWNFLDRSEREPSTEASFQACFGMNYGAMGAALAKFLPTAMRLPLEWRRDPAAADPSFDLRGATRAEVRRIQGEWARRAAGYIGGRAPALRPVYVGQARRALQSAYKEGDRDPRILASLGLLDVETGDVAAALPLLEAVLASGAEQPHALSELARLRLVEALGRPGAPGAHLTEQQAHRILEPIEAARRIKPPQYEAYAVATQVCARLAQPPTARELQILNEGSWLFAQNALLVLEAVAWDKQTGDLDQARRLVRLGEWRATDPVLRAKLQAMGTGL